MSEMLDPVANLAQQLLTGRIKRLPPNPFLPMVPLMKVVHYSSLELKPVKQFRRLSDASSKFDTYVYIHTLLSPQDPSNVVLAQGVPPMELFPLADLNIRLADGTEVALSQEDVQMAQRYTNQKST